MYVKNMTLLEKEQYYSQLLERALDAGQHEQAQKYVRVLEEINRTLLEVCDAD